MADPFSVTIGALATVEVCVKLGNFLNEVRKGASGVAQDLDDLSEKVSKIKNVSEIIRSTFENNWESSSDFSNKGDDGKIQLLWKSAGEYLGDCQSIVSELDQLIQRVFAAKDQIDDLKLRSLHDVDVAGTERSHDSVAISSSSTRGRLRLYVRKRGLEKQFRRIDLRLEEAWKSADLLLNAINIAVSRQAQRKTDTSLGSISENIISVGDRLESQIEALRKEFEDISTDTVERTLAAARSVRSLASINQYFEPPRTVDSNYTGRREALAELEKYLFGHGTSSQPGLQKRFCIYGLGGSGKTEFCCKFAQENQSKLWAVFWIDASTPLRVQQRYAEIAKLGQKDPNERAAKAWLASTAKPWLLIIDNAAHDADLEELQQYMPGGSSGMILITTRNPVHRTLGNLGCRYFHFKELVQEDANALLLRTAAEPTPWTAVAQGFATVIGRSLGFLPLPLRHAGITILRGLATLGNYLTYYEDGWQRVRASRRDISVDEDDHMKAYATYEIIYSGLEAKNTTQARDALDLLKTFSFLYWNNISENMVLQGAANAKLEREHQKRSTEHNKQDDSSSWRRDWFEQLQNMPALLYGLLQKIGTKSALPPVLRPTDNVKGIDVHRLRTALDQLTQLSLVFFNRDTSCYSMHPLVHEWVRERPGMSTAEQAVYCNAAATLMAQCVLIPPLGTDEAAEQLRREVCPHIDQVQKFKIDIEKSLETNRQTRSSLKWPIPYLKSLLGRETAIQLVKFSLVYSQSGRWHEAKALQETVRDFVLRYLGSKHTSAIDITLLLSSTLWQLGQGDAAAALQAEVLEICQLARGPEDLKSLKIMDALGVSRWLQGQFKSALALHEAATSGLERSQGGGHPDTLIAQGNLGRILAKQCRYEEAIDVHCKAVRGLQGIYGHSHLETLIAMDNLAMTYLDRFMYANGARSDLDTAHDLELHVTEERKTKLGPEHAYTLWAICNLARIKAAQGSVYEAEYMMIKGVKIAEINLGPNHIGTLFGKLYLGNTLVAGGKYDQAESTLNQVIEGHRALSRPNHPDALLAMSFLMRCYWLSKRNAEADRVQQKLVTGIEAIGAHDHPWRQQLLKPRMDGFGMHALPNQSVQMTGVGDDDIPRVLNRSSTV